MDILKKENYWIWVLLLLFSGGSSNLVLGALLNVFDKNAWYAKPRNWILGLVCLIIPFFIMIMIFYIEIISKANAKLGTPGKEIYLSPYIWILYLIVPIIGWIIFIVQFTYLSIWPVVMLYKGNGEIYGKKEV